MARILRLITICVALLFALAAVRAEKTKTVTGKLRSLKDNVMVIQKRGLVSDSSEIIEINDATKRIGQVVPGMHVKIKYREEAPDADGNRRKIAIEIEARPEFATKEAKEAAKQTTRPH